MKIAVTGASGFVGDALCKELEQRGHQVLRMVRGRPQPGIREAHWNHVEGTINENALRSCDAVIHLAGSNIAAGRWNPARKELIRSSRVAGTDFLARTLAGLEGGPKVLVSASAIGLYGNAGDRELTEESGVGSDFLAGVCRDWEAAAEPARAAGIRVAHIRVGLVVGPDGGAMKKMLPIFKLGLGGKLGSGQQYWSWIERGDLIRMFVEACENESWSGAFNGVAPGPVTNSEFTKTLGKVLGRPTFLPAPAFALRLVYGEMADALFFNSQRVSPARATGVGFSFEQPELEGALRHVLGR